MAAVYESTQNILPGQYGQSRLSFHADSAYVGRQHDHRSRNYSAGSFVTPNDQSPDAVPMEFALSDSPFSESDMEWLNMIVDSDSTSPMSNTLSDQDPFASSWSSHSPQTTQCYSMSQNVSSLDPFQFTQLQHSARPPNQANRHPPALYSSETFSPPCWSSMGRLHTPEIRFENLPQGEPVSASSLSARASLDPWSPVGQRYAGVAGSHDAHLFGPAIEEPYHTPYPTSISVMSLESSSPHHPGINTPSSSTRSPSFAHTNLQQPTSPRISDGGNLGSLGYGPDPDQTPKVAQNSFNHVHQGSLSYNIQGLGSLSQLASKRKRNDHAHREPTRSPFSSSEYVMVESSSKSASKAKRMESSPSESTIFVSEQYPPSPEDKRIRKAGELTMRKTSNGRKSGGRPLGMHLAPEKAAKAKDLRNDGACWICCLQRDSCTAGIECERCVKRSQRAQMENGLGCDRTRLTELKSIFIPDILNKHHESHALKVFVAEHIGRWHGSAIKLRFSCIFTLPPIECEVYEFEPKTTELLRKIEYFPSKTNGSREFVETHSPPLGMLQIESEDRQKYDKYVNRMVDNHLDQFAAQAFKWEENDFQGRLLKLMVQLHPDQKDEAILLRDIFRLQVVAYLMGRAPRIPSSQHHLLHSLHYSTTHRNVEYPRMAAASMVNRQLKYLFSAIFNSIMESVLKRLQQILRSSRGGAKWTSAFCAILGLAMCFEEIQRTVHGNQDIEAKKGRMTEWAAAQRAEESCRLIDEKFGFVANLFRWKYHRGFNPLRDWEDGKVQRTLGDSGAEFVRGVAGLVHEKSEFLYEKQHIAILRENQDKYTSRLVSRCLLSFWGPTLS